MEIKRNYIVDENNRRVAVQLDVKTFEIIEEILENYGLVQFMREDNEILDTTQAKIYYQMLEK